MANASDFWEQYKSNLRNRRPLWQRFLRLLFAFASALMIGFVCIAIERLTRMRWLVMLAGLVMAGLAVVTWWAAQAFLDRSKPYESSLKGPDPDVLDAEVVSTTSSCAAPPARSTDGMLLLSLTLVTGVLMLCCCGGLGTLATGLFTGRNALRNHRPEERGQSVGVTPQLQGNPPRLPFSDFQQRQEDLAKRTRQRQREIEGRVKQHQQLIKEKMRHQ